MERRNRPISCRFALSSANTPFLSNLRILFYISRLQASF